MPSPSPQKSEFAPGESAPVTGIYEVRHANHRETHSGILLAGEIFPECRTCKLNARFVLVREAEHIAGDSDLTSGVAARGKSK